MTKLCWKWFDFNYPFCGWKRAMAWPIGKQKFSTRLIPNSALLPLASNSQPWSFLCYSTRGNWMLMNLSKHLSDCPENWQTITIHHLFTHTSSLAKYDVGLEYQEIIHRSVTVDEIIALFKDRRLIFQPGENWQYSNSNYVLLGKIIEQVSWQSYESFLEENIFIPLDMKSSGYDHNNPDLAVGYKGDEIADYIDISWPFAARGLYSTVEDLYIWDRALYTEKLIPG